jgi:glycosyltransferase involved in cell wall biosynthesis
LHIVHIITTLQRGGAEACLANLLATWQQQNNNRHTVLYFRDGPTRQIIEKLGITCYQIAAPGGYANPLFLYRLLRKIKKLHPDCLHTDLWAANLLGRITAYFLSIPCISVIHIVAEHDGALRALIDRLIPITPYRYITVSESVRRSFIRKPRYALNKLVTIPNGINATQVIAAGQAGKTNLLNPLPAFAHAERSRSMKRSSGVYPELCRGGGHGRMSENGFLIGAVGRLVDFKNYPLLIKSFSQIAPRYPQAQLMIVGSGPEETALRQLTQDLALTERVTFIVGQQAMPYYQFFDCYVQPSFYEGLSIAVLEALCFSLPVIVTSQDGQHDIITNNQNGLIIPSNDLNALTQALIKLIENPKLRTQLGTAGYETATTTFAIARTAQAYTKVFEEAVGGKF